MIPSDGLLTGWRRTRSLVFLLLLTAAGVQDVARDHLSVGRAAAVLAGIALGAAGWIVISLSSVRMAWHIAAAAACIAAGCWLSVVQRTPDVSPAYLLVAGGAGAVRLPPRHAATLIGSGALLLGTILAVRGTAWPTIALWVGALTLISLISLLRRQSRQQAEQKQLLAEEQALADTLAERAHLAREIHDVLAHSLAALSVQLETAAALLERDRTEEAAAIVDKAGRLARDGLTEARRAVGTLRGDAIPLVELVGELVAGYRQDYDTKAELVVDGEQRELPPEAGLVLFRSAQEALANIRKHAPGSQVAVRIAYGKEAVDLEVSNRGDAGPPLTGLSTGYGLIGLRERAELAGGTANAGPCEDGWRVAVSIPA